MKTELTPGFNKAGIIGDLMRALIDDWYRQKSDQSAFKRQWEMGNQITQVQLTNTKVLVHKNGEN